MLQELHNNQMIVRVKPQGAELVEIINKETNKQYLWTADKEYILPQHGFARDMEFDLLDKSSDEIWYSLKASEETKENYPFDFRLNIGYKIKNRSIQVMWKVENLDTKKMYFSIGAHPGFLCPMDDRQKQSGYSFRFEGINQLKVQKITKDGLRASDYNILKLEDNCLPIHEHLFDDDALVLENSQVNQVSILTPQNKPYVTVRFDAPVVGIWSPAKKKAPFVCIEPWYGRCDAVDFEGNLENREWGNCLEPGGVFNASYEIEIA